MDRPLFSSFPLGHIMLPNRIVMAPLTRSRAGADGMPSPLMASYYSQRAGAGLIISEATNISRQGTGYPFTPGIYTNDHIEGWKEVTRAVHSAGGRIFMQLWHVGRHSHPIYQEDGGIPVSASAIRERGSIKTPGGITQTVQPLSLDTAGIRAITGQYGQAAENAIKAGFDGVEIHAANGYLIEQFLHDGTNRRTDAYGGSRENRSRFLFEVVEEVSRRIKAERTGIRLSPGGERLNVHDSDPAGLFTYVIKRLNDSRLAYLHIIEPLNKNAQILKGLPSGFTPYFRKRYSGTLITNGGYDAESGNKAIAGGIADLVSYGKPFISNPDLVRKFYDGSEISPWNENTFYTQGKKGYTDFA